MALLYSKVSKTRDACVGDAIEVSELPLYHITLDTPEKYKPPSLLTYQNIPVSFTMIFFQHFTQVAIFLHDFVEIFKCT